MNLGLVLFAGLLAAMALAFFLPAESMIGGMPAGAFAANAAYGLLAVAMAASLIHRYRGRLGAGMRDALIWVGLACALIAGYAYRDQWAPLREKFMSELSPGAVVSPAPGIAEVARRRDGHYVLDMQANGATLRFLFDTGASSVVIRAEDAAKLGVNVDKLNFSQVISTANGVSRAAEITLDRLTVGSISLTRVRAMVARPGGLAENLLGMSFLERLASFSVENSRLVLRSK